MTSSRRRIIAFCTLMLAAAPSAAEAQRSAADIESARQLYNQGIALRDRGDQQGALEKFRAAHALGNTPITGIELCRSHAALAQPVEAREVCLGVARIPPLAGETSRSQDARNEAARIAEEVKPRIASLRIRITGVPQGREPTVTVDGATVPPAALGEPRAVNPGPHTVIARVGSGAETRSGIELREGEVKEITLPVQAPPAEPPPPVAGGYPPPAYGPGPRPRERSSALATTGWVIAGVGVGVGAVTGIVALSAKGDLDDKCTNKICGVDEHDDLDRAKAFGTVSTVGFVVGGIGLVIGLVGTLNQPSSARANAPPPPKPARASVTPVLGPGGVGLHGSF